MSDIQFVEIDSEKITNNLIKTFEETIGETLYPGDERRIFLQNFAPVLVALKNDINNTGKQNLLRYASGETLDAVGVDWFNVTRLPAQKSNTTLKFTLSTAQLDDVTIPEGTRATPDGELFFATSANLVINAGNTYGEILAESTEAGANYNDFIAGQIKSIVDPVPFVQSVENTNTSTGGSDIENDSDYRERIQISLESYSVAGPAGAYKYWALTADATISDVDVSSPSPGVVQVTVLLEGGEIPSQAILDKVEAILSSDTIRPLTDNVQVAAATEETYDIDLTYYISNDDAANETNIRNLIESSGGAVDQYIAWQCLKLGRSINPDELRRLILNSGACKIDITTPMFTEVNNDTVAKVDTINIAYGGLISL